MDSQTSHERNASASSSLATLAVDWDGTHVSCYPDDPPPPRRPLVRLAYLLVNCWLVFHLFAIIICPASVEPASPLAQSCFDLVSPYMHFLYLDHGFHFFAPEPGGSTLVSYTLEFKDGSTKSGRFPNREIFPRLFYHRHFMLTEFLGNGPEDLQPLVERAFARNLCRSTGALRVSLTKVEHETASVEDILHGLTLNDSSLFKETPLGTYSAEELRFPLKPPPETPPNDSPIAGTEGAAQLPDASKELP